MYFFGVSLYAFGGGTIPLIRESLTMGMSMGRVPVFMITSPATKITNLGALKIVLGMKRFFAVSRLCHGVFAGDRLNCQFGGINRFAIQTERASVSPAYGLAEAPIFACKRGVFVWYP